MTHYLRGSLFENFVITELMKHAYNQGRDPRLYFFRDKAGHEVDCILQKAAEFIPIEIKSAKTIAKDFFAGLEYWNKDFAGDPARSYIIYGGIKIYNIK
jgi:uncharacterized protein